MQLLTKIKLKSLKFFLILSALLSSPIALAYPPFSGTIFIDPDIMVASDPSAFQRVSYAGQGTRYVFDRRRNAFVNVYMHLVTAYYTDGSVIEIQVNPELGSSTQAVAKANYYGFIIGQIPQFLRQDVKTTTIHAGNMPFGGGNENLLIHTGKTTDYLASGILEETLIHEAGHTSIDPYYTRNAAWNAAQYADREYISTYGRDNPYREDLAESILPWIAINYRANRITQSLNNTIRNTIPNRLAFFDAQNFNMSPMTGDDGGSTTVPITPTSLRASNITGNSFTASWTAVNEATSYGLQRWSDSANTWLDVGTSTTPSIDISGLIEQDQWVKVKATNSAGSSDHSDYIHVELLTTTTSPITPTGLGASNITSNSLTATWTPVDGATSYSLQRWSDSTNTWLDAGTSTTQSKNITGLTEQDQWIRVNATNSAGSSNYSEFIYVRLQTSSCTSAPAIPSGISGNSQVINWNAVSQATGYNIQYWTGGIWADHGNALAARYTLGLSGTQYVRIRAANSCGSSNYSSWITVY